MKITETYSQEFEQGLSRFSGDKTLYAIRKKAMEDFISQGGIPSAKAEDWRYAPISSLRQNHLPRTIKNKGKVPVLKAITDWPVVIVRNGEIISSPTITGLEILSPNDLKPEWTKDYNLGCVDTNPFERLNLALADGGLNIHVQKSIQTEGLEVIFVNDGLDQTTQYLRNLILLQDGVFFPVLMRTINSGNSGWVNMVTNIHLSKNSSLNLSTDFESAAAILQSAVFNGILDNDTNFDYRTVATELTSFRHEIELRMNGKHAKANLIGGMLAAKDESLDFLTRVYHMESDTISNQKFKGVSGSEGKTAFQGRIVVAEQSQKTDARQNCNNLILHHSGEVNIKPELLIFADDVACAHGATVGEIDENELFYLMQRGISEPVARSILVKAFFGEVVEGFVNNPLQSYFEHKIHTWMKKSGSIPVYE